MITRMRRNYEFPDLCQTAGQAREVGHVVLYRFHLGEYKRELPGKEMKVLLGLI